MYKFAFVSLCLGAITVPVLGDVQTFENDYPVSYRKPALCP